MSLDELPDEILQIVFTSDVDDKSGLYMLSMASKRMRLLVEKYATYDICTLRDLETAFRKNDQLNLVRFLQQWNPIHCKLYEDFHERAGPNPDGLPKISYLKPVDEPWYNHKLIPELYWIYSRQSKWFAMYAMRYQAANIVRIMEKFFWLYPRDVAKALIANCLRKDIAPFVVDFFLNNQMWNYDLSKLHHIIALDDVEFYRQVQHRQLLRRNIKLFKLHFSLADMWGATNIKNFLSATFNNKIRTLENNRLRMLGLFTGEFQYYTRLVENQVVNRKRRLLCERNIYAKDLVHWVRVFSTIDTYHDIAVVQFLISQLERTSTKTTNISRKTVEEILLNSRYIRPEVGLYLVKYYANLIGKTEKEVIAFISSNGRRGINDKIYTFYKLNSYTHAYNLLPLSEKQKIAFMRNDRLGFCPVCCTRRKVYNRDHNHKYVSPNARDYKCPCGCDVAQCDGSSCTCSCYFDEPNRKCFCDSRHPAADMFNVEHSPVIAFVGYTAPDLF